MDYVDINIESPNLGVLAEQLSQLDHDGVMPLDYRTADASYDGPDGRVQAQKLVVRMHSASLVRVIGLVYQLCVEHEQDCAAVKPSYAPALLVGPNAVKWNPFNPDFFEAFE